MKIIPFKNQILAGIVVFIMFFIPGSLQAQSPASLRIGHMVPANSQRIGRTFVVDVLMDTGGKEVSGVDIELTFDPVVLQAEKVSKGTVVAFSSYPALTIDNVKGKIIISANVGSSAKVKKVAGNNLVIAQLSFKPKAVSQKTKIDFQFTDGDRNDSNIALFDAAADDARDILAKVYPLTFSVEGSRFVCLRKSQGDANCNGKVTFADMQIWFSEYTQKCSAQSQTHCGGDSDLDGDSMDANFNYPGSKHPKTDRKVTIQDFMIMRNYMK